MSSFQMDGKQDQSNEKEEKLGDNIPKDHRPSNGAELENSDDEERFGEEGSQKDGSEHSQRLEKPPKTEMGSYNNLIGSNICMMKDVQTMNIFQTDGGQEGPKD